MKTAFVFAAGLFDAAIVVFHVLFWRLFRWPESLAGSGRLNSAITQTLNVMLTYVFAVYAAALLWQGSGAGPALLLPGVGFGVLRIWLQVRLFGVESRLSRVFTGLMALGTFLHLIPSAIPG